MGLRVALEHLEEARKLLRTAPRVAEDRAKARVESERQRGITISPYPVIAGALTAHTESAAFHLEQAIRAIQSEMRQNENTAVCETAVG